MNLLSSIFGVGVRMRNSLYDRGTARAQSLQGPVVSVGNLSVGGSGKTPFVLLLGELLTAKGVKFDILSRGYGRARDDGRASGRSRRPRFGAGRPSDDGALRVARRNPLDHGLIGIHAGRGYRDDRFLRMPSGWIGRSLHTGSGPLARNKNLAAFLGAVVHGEH